MITYRNQILINNNIIITGCNNKFRMPIVVGDHPNKSLYSDILYPFSLFLGQQCIFPHHDGQWLLIFNCPFSVVPVGVDQDVSIVFNQGNVHSHRCCSMITPTQSCRGTLAGRYVLAHEICCVCKSTLQQPPGCLKDIIHWSVPVTWC